eukprot:10718043-Heterocapsa_arctica.AAC.1
MSGLSLIIQISLPTIVWNKDFSFTSRMRVTSTFARVPFSAKWVSTGLHRSRPARLKMVRT